VRCGGAAREARAQRRLIGGRAREPGEERAAVGGREGNVSACLGREVERLLSLLRLDIFFLISSHLGGSRHVGQGGDEV
jgi:hypothetical protein